MSERAVTPEEVWEWIEQDTLPGLRDAVRRDYLDMLNSVRASAWDEGYAVGQTDHDCDATNPYRKEDER